MVWCSREHRHVWHPVAQVRVHLGVLFHRRLCAGLCECGGGRSAQHAADRFSGTLITSPIDSTDTCPLSDPICNTAPIGAADDGHVVHAANGRLLRRRLERKLLDMDVSLFGLHRWRYTEQRLLWRGFAERSWRLMLHNSVSNSGEWPSEVSWTIVDDLGNEEASGGAGDSETVCGSTSAPTSQPTPLPSPRPSPIPSQLPIPTPSPLPALLPILVPTPLSTPSPTLSTVNVSTFSALSSAITSGAKINVKLVVADACTVSRA